MMNYMAENMDQSTQSVFKERLDHANDIGVSTMYVHIWYKWLYGVNLYLNQENLDYPSNFKAVLAKSVEQINSRPTFFFN